LIDPHINKVQLSYLKSKLSHFQPKEITENEGLNQEDDSLSDDDDFEVDDEQIPEAEEMSKNHDQIAGLYSLKGK
jgi:Ran GTPase-activating protein (RanGAP) involved in mRNA processing and transport